MNAADMRKLTDRVNQQRAAAEAKARVEAEAKRLEAGEFTKSWWLTHGVAQIFDKVHEAAEKGDSSYVERLHEPCPDYVVKYIRDSGFEVASSSPRQRFYAGDLVLVHTLTIGW